jgi:hypothetical protein
MKIIEPRLDIIKLSILVMKSKVSVKIKEQFLLSMIKPIITQQPLKMSLKDIKI